MRRKMILGALFLTMILSSCGTSVDSSYYKNLDEEKKNIKVTALSHSKEDVQEAQETKNPIENSDLDRYLSLGTYENVVSVTDDMLKSTGDDKADYENKKQIVDDILKEIIQNSQFSDIDNLVEQKYIDMLVSQINQNIANNDNVDVETVKNQIMNQAEYEVKKELVVSALKDKFQVFITEQQYADKMNELAQMYGYETTDAFCEVVGQEQIKSDILCYTSVGIAKELIDDNQKSEDVDRENNRDDEQQNVTDDSQDEQQNQERVPVQEETNHRQEQKTDSADNKTNIEKPQDTKKEEDTSPTQKNPSSLNQDEKLTEQQSTTSQQNNMEGGNPVTPDKIN